MYQYLIYENDIIIDISSIYADSELCIDTALQHIHDLEEMNEKEGCYQYRVIEQEIIERN